MVKQSRAKKKKMELKRELSVSNFTLSIKDKLNEVIETVEKTKNIAENATNKLNYIDFQRKNEKPEKINEEFVEKTIRELF